MWCAEGAHTPPALTRPLLSGLTALFLASCNGRAEAVAALLAAGADACPPPDAEGLTPLYAAAFNGHALATAD